MQWPKENAVIINTIKVDQLGSDGRYCCHFTHVQLDPGSCWLTASNYIELASVGLCVFRIHANCLLFTARL